jgi:hypothetical protein
MKGTARNRGIVRRHCYRAKLCTCPARRCHLDLMAGGISLGNCIEDAMIEIIRVLQPHAVNLMCSNVMLSKSFTNQPTRPASI